MHNEESNGQVNLSSQAATAPHLLPGRESKPVENQIELRGVNLPSSVWKLVSNSLMLVGVRMVHMVGRKIKWPLSLKYLKNGKEPGKLCKF